MKTTAVAINPNLNRGDSDSQKRDGFLQRNGIAPGGWPPDGPDDISQGNAQAKGSHHEDHAPRIPHPPEDHPIDAEGYQTGENGREQNGREDVESQGNVEYECQIDTHDGVFGMGEIGKLQQVIDQGETEGDEAQFGCSNDTVDNDLGDWHCTVDLGGRKSK